MERHSVRREEVVVAGSGEEEEDEEAVAVGLLELQPSLAARTLTSYPRMRKCKNLRDRARKLTRGKFGEEQRDVTPRRPLPENAERLSVCQGTQPSDQVD